MKAGWTTKPLGELCDILDSRRKPVTKSDRIAGPYPYYGATGIQDFVNDFLFDEPLVLVGEDGAKWESGENTAFPIEGKCWVNNHAHVLRPIRERLLDNWLIHFLNHSDLTEYVSGLTVPKLNQGSLREIRIPLAPIEEQRRIVTLLDEVFADIATSKANAEKNLQNARSIFQIHLDSFFEPSSNRKQEKRLMDALADQPRNGWSPPAANHSDTGTPVLTLSAVTGYKFRPEKIKHTSAPTNIDSHYWVVNGDLLLTRSNTPELVGHVAVATDIERPTIYPDLIMRMNADPHKAINRFLYYQLRSTKLRQIIMDRAHGANPTMKKVGKTDVQTLPIWLPSLHKQQQIANGLEEIEIASANLESIYRQKLTALDDLKKSLLHQAFSGQLTQ